MHKQSHHFYFSQILWMMLPYSSSFLLLTGAELVTNMHCGMWHNIRQTFANLYSLVGNEGFTKYPNVYMHEVC